MRTHYLILSALVGLSGCTYLAGPEESVHQYFKSLSERDFDALKSRTAEGVSVIDMVNALERCGRFTNIETKEVGREGGTAQFQVTLTNTEGKEYLVPGVEVRKESLQWLVQSVLSKNSHRETIKGGSFVTQPSGVLETGPEMKGTYSSAFPAFYVVERTVDSCAADKAELEKRNLKADSDKEALQEQFRKWEAEETVRQREREARALEMAEAAKAREASQREYEARQEEARQAKEQEKARISRANAYLASPQASELAMKYAESYVGYLTAGDVFGAVGLFEGKRTHADGIASWIRTVGGVSRVEYEPPRLIKSMLSAEPDAIRINIRLFPPTNKPQMPNYINLKLSLNESGNKFIQK